MDFAKNDLDLKPSTSMILCCGEALIDMIPCPTASGADEFVPHPGGAIFNTAISLGRLGVPVGMLTGISNDLFGKQLRDALVASNVDTSLIIESDRPTTLAFVKLTDGHASYSFYDENTAGRTLTPSDLPNLGDNVSAMYFGGISLACEPGAEAYAALLEEEGRDSIIMIDPNIRPSFIDDEARYRTRLERMIANADIVKLSDEDLDWLQAGSKPQSTKAKWLLEQGPSLVSLTRGSAGATAFLSTGEEVNVAAHSVNVVDTVGAGDTFNAGVLCKLAELGLLNKDRLTQISSDHVEDALQFGAKVAAITVSRAGANPPWAAEL